jgi:hypothetical protein
MAFPLLIDNVWAFGSAIWGNWPTIAITGIGATLTGFFARQSAKNQNQLRVIRPILRWLGDNKFLFTVMCVFLSFVWASFSAFNTERQEKDAAVEAAKKPSLDPTLLYQDGFPAASFAQMTTNANDNTISFAMITSTHALDMSKAFEFRDWKMLCSGQADGSMTYGATERINYVNVVCRIQSVR